MGWRYFELGVVDVDEVDGSLSPKSPSTIIYTRNLVAPSSLQPFAVLLTMMMKVMRPSCPRFMQNRPTSRTSVLP